MVADAFAHLPGRLRTAATTLLRGAVGPGIPDGAEVAEIARVIASADFRPVLEAEALLDTIALGADTGPQAAARLQAAE